MNGKVNVPTSLLSNTTNISQEKNKYEVLDPLDPLHVAADSQQPPSIGRPPVPNVNACFTIRPRGFSGGRKLVDCGPHIYLGVQARSYSHGRNPLIKQIEQKLYNYDYRL